MRQVLLFCSLIPFTSPYTCCLFIHVCPFHLQAVVRKEPRAYTGEREEAQEVEGKQGLGEGGLEEEVEEEEGREQERGKEANEEKRMG